MDLNFAHMRQRSLRQNSLRVLSVAECLDRLGRSLSLPLPEQAEDTTELKATLLHELDVRYARLKKEQRGEAFVTLWHPKTLFTALGLREDWYERWLAHRVERQGLETTALQWMKDHIERSDLTLIT